MLRLVNDDYTPPEPDTDFAFLADSEPDTTGGLRTVLHEKTQPQGDHIDHCRDVDSWRFRAEGSEVFSDRGDLLYLEACGRVGCNQESVGESACGGAVSE